MKRLLDWYISWTLTPLRVAVTAYILWVVMCLLTAWFGWMGGVFSGILWGVSIHYLYGSGLREGIASEVVRSLQERRKNILTPDGKEDSDDLNKQ